MSGWRIDGWVKCPSCSTWCDAAAVFGCVPLPPDDEDDIGIKDGTSGTCDSCQSPITIRLDRG